MVMRRIHTFRAMLRLAWRDMRRHRARTAFSTILIALPMAALLIGVTLMMGAPPIRERTLKTIPEGAQAVVTATAVGRESGAFAQPPEGRSQWVDDIDQHPADVEELRRMLPAADRLIPYWQSEQLIAVTGDGLEPGGSTSAEASSTSDALLRSGASTARLCEGGEESLAMLLPRLEEGEAPRSETDMVITSALASSIGAGVDRHYLVVGDEPVTWDQVKAMNKVQAMTISRYALTDGYPHADELYPAHIDGTMILQYLVGFALALGMGCALVLCLVTPAFAISADQSRRTMPLALRLGLRDSAEHHRRFVPATIAVVLTMALASYAMVLTGSTVSENRHRSMELVQGQSHAILSAKVPVNNTVDRAVIADAIRKLGGASTFAGNSAAIYALDMPAAETTAKLSAKAYNDVYSRYPTIKVPLATSLQCKTGESGQDMASVFEPGRTPHTGITAITDCPWSAWIPAP